MKPQFTYIAIVNKIHDGDTCTVVIDLGFYVTVTENVRFLGINAPELNTEAGKRSWAYLNSIMPVGSVIAIKTFSRAGDKYGRWLAQIEFNGEDINQKMVDSGNAVVL